VIQSLTNLFSHRFQSTICCVLPSIGADQLMVQTKDERLMESMYTLVHFGLQTTLSDGIKIHDSWFQIPLALYSDKTIIQYFPNDQNPEEKVIIKYDFSKGGIDWEHANIDYAAIIDDGVLLRDANGYYLLNDLNELNEINPSQIQEIVTNQFDYPSFFGQDEIEFSEMADIVEKLTGQKVHLGVEYLEYNQYILISYFAIDGIKFNNFLIVLDSTGKIALHQKINGEMKGLGRDTFFILAEKLIFVSNKTTLNVYVI
jgi:hypothetical protein